ncbi:hypothetical protein ACH5RR_040825 [Cinchona calisaya]|uniref:Uncharacterized protein n=1 Tax=Cinchona calisaya TaxID=153742 RepID=A0ABD2XX73_9GENT
MESSTESHNQLLDSTEEEKVPKFSLDQNNPALLSYKDKLIQPFSSSNLGASSFLPYSNANLFDFEEVNDNLPKVKLSKEIKMRICSSFVHTLIAKKEKEGNRINPIVSGNKVSSRKHSDLPNNHVAPLHCKGKFVETIAKKAIESESRSSIYFQNSGQCLMETPDSLFSENCSFLDVGGHPRDLVNRYLASSSRNTKSSISKQVFQVDLVSKGYHVKFKSKDYSSNATGKLATANLPTPNSAEKGLDHAQLSKSKSGSREEQLGIATHLEECGYVHLLSGAEEL